MSWQPGAEPVCTENQGAVALVIEGQARDLGGFEVRRVLPSPKRRLVGPFIFFDEMGPVDFPPGRGIDVRPHPHIGLATVTYLFDGEILHRDSLGVVQPIQPGAVNWMTAGRGIVHSERTDPARKARGARLHGIQSWVALPSEHEETDPDFTHYPADSLPLIERDGATLRLIAGKAYGQASPVATRSAMFYLDAELAADAELALPDDEERAVYVVQGSIGVAGARFGAGQMVVFEPGMAVSLIAAEASRVMLLGGAPIGGKRHIWWNFVSSDPDRIEQAKADWQAGRFDAVPGETEFIPLPEN